MAYINIYIDSCFHAPVHKLNKCGSSIVVYVIASYPCNIMCDQYEHKATCDLSFHIFY